MTYIAKMRDVIAVPADQDALTESWRAVSPAQDKGSAYVDASQYGLYRSIVGGGGKGHVPLLAFRQALTFEELDLLEKPDTEGPVHEMGVTPLDENPYEKPMSVVESKKTGLWKNPDVSNIIKGLEDDNWEVRETAAAVAVEFREIHDYKDAVPALGKALEDVNENVRARAAFTLWHLGPAAKDAMNALIKALGDPVEEVRAFAASALGRIEPAAKDKEKVIDALVKALNDPSLVVRKSAAVSLATFGPAGKAAVPMLLEGLDASEEGYYWEEVRSLGCIGPAAKGAVATLIRLLDEHIVATRLTTAGAIGETLLFYKQDVVTRRLAAKALGKIGSKKAILALRRATKDRDKDVAKAATEALRKIRVRKK